jgi:hypothetical protein
MHLICLHVERDIARMQKAVCKIFLDYIALLAEADDKVAYSVARIDLHDVPQDRFVTDLNHLLRSRPGFFREARPNPPASNTAFKSSSNPN